MQIYFHSRLWSYLPRVPILVEGTVYIYIYIYIYIRGGTVHVFVSNHHGTGISVRCMRPHDEYRQFPPNPEGGARSNTTLFDNR